MAWLFIPRSVGSDSPPTADGARVEEVEDGWKVALPAGVIGIGRRRPPSWAHAWLTLSDVRVSRAHCRITTGDDGSWISEENSAGGTLVNWEAVPAGRPRQLRHGDELLRLGIRFHAHGG